MQTAARLLPMLVGLLLVTACATGAPPSRAPDPSPTPGPVTSAEDALARLLAAEPRLTGMGPRDPELIGQSAWYEVSALDGAYGIEVYLGWGDCIAGCIESHHWQWLVAGDGTVTLAGEQGDAVPDDQWPSPGGTGRTGILVHAVAGPICPVERVPPDPACQPRPVPAAPIAVHDDTGATVAEGTTGQDGRLFIELTAGSYTVVAAPVDGLMAAPAPVDVVVTVGEAPVELAYDTGIR